MVGSGFGGAVSAAGLAARGMRVLILERGPWWGHLQQERPASDRRELPRGLFGIHKLLRSVRVARRGRREEQLLHPDGLLELHRFEHLRVITASGVGGGSHVYTGILEEPAAEFFESFPPEISAAEMRPHFRRVRAVLRPARVPPLPEKVRVFQDAVRAAELPEPELAELGIVFGKDPTRQEKVINVAGVRQWTSTWQSDALVGCSDGSKTTLDLTFIPIALRHGAELRPLCEVTAIEPADDGYTACYVDHRTAQQVRVTARRLVLAAGGLNTQRLLFRARDASRSLPALPPTLGRRFSPNADFATLVLGARVGADLSRGPSIAALTRVRDGATERFLLAEVSLPVDALPLPESLRRVLRRSLFLLCMGRDASKGTLEFDGAGLTTSAGRSADAALYSSMEETIARVARAYEPKRLLSGFLAPRGGEGLLTVHPLGGCSMGRSVEDGFTDHRGQVFGHPGLFVADGSLYPRSPGIPPSLTIAALADRQAELMD